MDRKTKWRTFWLGLLTVLAIIVLLPSVLPSDSKLLKITNGIFRSKIQLGLDLQGGVHIVYGIDLNQAVEDKAAEIKRDLQAKLDERKIPGRVTFEGRAVGGVNVVLENKEALAKLGDKFLSDYSDDIKMRTCTNTHKDTSLCLRVASDYADSIKNSALRQAIKTVRQRINERGIAEPTVIRKGDDIIVELPGLDKAETERVKSLIKRTAKLEFKIVDEYRRDKPVAGRDYPEGGTYKPHPFMRNLYQFVQNDSVAKELGIKVSTDGWQHDKSGEQFYDYYVRAEDRSERISVTEAKKRGCYNRNMDVYSNTVTCQVPGSKVLKDYLKALGKKTPKFKPDDDHEFGYEFIRVNRKDAKSFWRTHYLFRQVELGGSSVSKAQVVFNPTTNFPEVLITFNRYGGNRFGELTGRNVGRRMAIILDDKVNSAPVIQAKIAGGRSTITMGGHNAKEVYKEAQDLVDVLRTGSLPAPLKEESSSYIGPLLGRDAISKTKFSFMLGSLLVIIMMLYVYRVSGTIAILTLVLNLLLMLAVLALFGATLTLPGIAALVLTVGMAVDANIIIYERIREELRAGKSVRGAVDAGFGRAFSAILDGQLTTGIAGYILMTYGSGPIKGFAVMLIIGIICTLFTATWCSRLFFEHYVGRGRKAAQISI